mgnify:CR=1 FL=1
MNWYKPNNRDKPNASRLAAVDNDFLDLASSTTPAAPAPGVPQSPDQQEPQGQLSPDPSVTEPALLDPSRPTPHPMGKIRPGKTPGRRINRPLFRNLPSKGIWRHPPTGLVQHVIDKQEQQTNPGAQEPDPQLNLLA